MKELDVLTKAEQVLNNDVTERIFKQMEWIDNLNPLLELSQKMERLTAQIQMPSADVFEPFAKIEKALNSSKSAFASIEKLNEIYSKTLEQNYDFDKIFSSVSSAFAQQDMLTKAFSNFDISKTSHLPDILTKVGDAFFMVECMDFHHIEELYKNGEITDDDIAEEISEIVSNKSARKSVSENWSEVKKAKWFLAVRILLVLITFLLSPVIERAKENALDVTGITRFYEESGLLDFIDKLFGIEETAKSEEEAKKDINKENIGNASKKSRDELIAKIKEIRTFISSAPQDENTGNLLAYLSEIEKDVNGKKYGLIFEEHREEIDEVLDTHTPVLTEETDLFIDNGGEINFLIEGDNLASLQLLEKTHKGKINVIYIDPPYNTGAKDWRYNNEFVDDNDSFRHSKWLSWLKSRLVFAKKMLCDTGIIVVTIDDYEIATLRLLLDEIFGNENYLGTVAIRNNPSGRSTVRGLSINHEYALFYSSTTQATLGRMEHSDTQKARYDEKDENGYFEWENFRKNGTDSDRKDRPKQFYPIFIDETTQKLRIPEINWNDETREYDILEIPTKSEVVLYPITKGNEKVWKYGLERTKSIINEILVKKTKQGYELYRKKYLNTEGSLPRTWWDKPEYSARDNGTRTLTNLFGPQKVFDFPKAPEAVKDALIAANLRKDGIVLDFFAGSGTTAQATLELNKKDNGHRRFILCTNNENNICRDVTYERIKRVIDKEQYQTSLKYYKVKYVPINEKMYYEYADELLLHIRELVELENGINFISNSKIAIVLTDDELDVFVNDIEEFSQCKKLYIGHDLLPTEEQEKVISEHEIEVNIIPDYYYRDLQEG